MSLHATKIFGISVTVSSKKEILEEIQKYLLGNPKSEIRNPKQGAKPFVIVTPNPEQIVLAQNDKHFAEILNQTDVAIPDGIGLQLANQFHKSEIRNPKSETRLTRIPGVELMEELVQLAAKRGYEIGLIGGRGGVAVEVLECLRRKYGQLNGWAEEAGEVTIRQIRQMPQIRQMIHNIHSTNTRIVFVGLGAPKQEYFVAALQRQLSLRGASLRATRQSLDLPVGDAGIASSSERSRNDGVVLMSVGGSFDILAGRVKRAPLFLRNIGLEWLWRLVREPWRWRRQLALIKFIWLLIAGKN